MDAEKTQETPEITDTVEEAGETKEEKKVESKESVIDKIGEKVRSFFSKEEEQVEEKVAEIPVDFANAAKKLGWKPEDVTEFAKDYTTEELTEMIPSLIGEGSEESEETSNTEDEKSQETKEKKVEDSQEGEKIQKLLDRIEALEKAQGKSQEERQEQETVSLVNRASQMFDEASKEFEVFGKTESLPKFPDGRIVPTSPQLKARNEVWELAYRLKGSGLDFDRAMSVALDAFKGKNLVKDVKRSVIKDLKEHEKRLGGKRISHESSSKTMSGPDIIGEVLKKHGREPVD